MAKKFEFRLQNVLQIRQKLEDIRAIELKQAQISLMQEEEKLQEISSKKEAYLQQAFLGETVVDPFNLKIQTAYTNQLNYMINMQNKSVQKAEEHVDEKRTILLKASQDKKIVEKLKERKEEEFSRSMAQHEIISNSEIALRRLQSENWGIGQ
jgi:flagellar protein FliJ